MEFDVITLEDVESVYSGRPGCCCGCVGKHTYSSTCDAEILQKYASGKSNDKQVKRVFNILQENANRVNKCSDTCFFLDYTDKRVYGIYLKGHN